MCKLELSGRKVLLLLAQTMHSMGYTAFKEWGEDAMAEAQAVIYSTHT